MNSEWDNNTARHFRASGGPTRCCWSTPIALAALAVRGECRRYPDLRLQFGDLRSLGVLSTQLAVAPFLFVSAAEPFPFRASEMLALISSPLISPWMQLKFTLGSSEVDQKGALLIVHVVNTARKIVVIKIVLDALVGILSEKASSGTFAYGLFRRAF
jgi:hypothetical protein